MLSADGWLTLADPWRSVAIDDASFSNDVRRGVWVESGVVCRSGHRFGARTHCDVCAGAMNGGVGLRVPNHRVEFTLDTTRVAARATLCFAVCVGRFAPTAPFNGSS